MSARPLFLAALCTACTGATPPPPSADQVATTPATSAPAAPPAATPRVPPAAPPAASGPASCGELGCRSFDGVEQAFAAVLASQPLVLGIGEAHAQRGSEGVESTTRRFTQQILPLLKGKASFLAVELLLPNPKCQRETKQVEKQQKPVTEPQAQTNQSEYVTLGQRARELGIVPDLLRPSCEDLTRITQAGADDIAVMLETIARLTREVALAELERNRKAGKELLVVAYGGALHNDLVPRAGRESWSYGPALGKATGDRYVELDLIVPEYIRDAEPWTSLPWVKHYDRARLGTKVVLFNPTPRSFVLVFPVTSAHAPPAPAAPAPSAAPPSAAAPAPAP